MAVNTADSTLLKHRSETRNIDGSLLLRVGAIAGIAGGMMMAMWQMIVGAVAQSPTAVAGVNSSFWTAVTAIPSVPFGESWFHSDFDVGSVFVGLMGHMMNSTAIGIAGVALIVGVLGRRPSLARATAIGMALGVVIQVVLVNGVINGLVQDTPTLYTSTPEWSWWVAHALFGGVLGMFAAALLRRSNA